MKGIYLLSGPVAVKVRERPVDLVSRTDHPPWRSAATRKIRERNRTRRLAKLPSDLRDKDSGDLLDWMRWNAIEQDAVYCSECHDYVPGDQLCQHSLWCDTVSWYSTPSSRLDCKHCIGGVCRERFDVEGDVDPWFRRTPLWVWSAFPILR